MSAEQADTIDILINVVREYAFDEVERYANGALRVRGLCPEVQGHYCLVLLNERLECSVTCDSGCNSGGDSLTRDFAQMFQTALRQKLNAEQPSVEQQPPVVDDSELEQAEAPPDDLYENVSEQPLKPEPAPKPEESPSAAATDKSESDPDLIPPGRYAVRMRIYAHQRDKQGRTLRDGRGKPLWRRNRKGQTYWQAKLDILSGPHRDRLLWDRLYFADTISIRTRALAVALGLMQKNESLAALVPKDFDGTLWWVTLAYSEYNGRKYPQINYAPLSAEEAKAFRQAGGGVTDPTAATHDEYCADHCRLLPHHRQLLIDSAIKPEIARDRSYRSVLTQSELRNYGFRTSRQSVPTLLIPSYGPKGELATYQHRPDTRRSKGDPPRPVKYESPSRKPPRIDVPLSLSRKVKIERGEPYFDTTEAPGPIANPNIALFITEGVRKADSAASYGLCCIALLGVWGWRGTNDAGGKTALADWDDIALNGRSVYIVFDSDVMTNPNVQAALSRLQTFLIRREAVVKFIYLPPGPHGEKVGLDDFIAAQIKDGTAPEQLRVKLLEIATSELRASAGATNSSYLNPEGGNVDAQGRLLINISGKQLREKVGETLTALQLRNEPPALFARDGRLVRLREGGSELEELDGQGLLAEMAEAANWVRNAGLKAILFT